MVADYILLRAQDYRNALIAHFFAQKQYIFGLISDRARAARPKINGPAHELEGLVREDAGGGDRALRALSLVDRLTVEVVFFAAGQAVADIGLEGALSAFERYGAVVIGFGASRHYAVPAKKGPVRACNPDIVIGQAFR